MFRFIASVVLAGSVLTGCCSIPGACPVCPGNPTLASSGGNNPDRPVVWKILRGGDVIAVAWESAMEGNDPATASRVVWSHGVLPFRPTDVFVPVDTVSSGIDVPLDQLCGIFRDLHPRVRRGTVPTSALIQWNQITNDGADCPPCE